ncbi:MAG TPA: penicillin-binding protein 2 [Burkholderiales bacterium]
MTELKNAEKELSAFRLRLVFAALMVFVCFCVLFGRFFFLQVLNYDEYQSAAEDNRISILPIAPNRGLIYDRNGVVLARNYSAYTLEITPSKVADLEATIDELAKLVDVSQKDRKRFAKLMGESRNFDSLPIRTRLTDEEVARFAANRWRFKGVEIKARLFRQYPLGETAAHVLGYIGRISEKDQEHLEDQGLESNYKGSDYIGKIGIEQSYEKELHGQTGFEQVEVDAGGRAVRTLSRTPPVSGNNLYLTIDIELQKIAEQALGDRKGAVVAIDPYTGEVLAFASRPAFDPNLFVDGIDSANWDALNTSPDKPLLNRPLRGTYPPGSTFKPFMALAGLATGKRTPEQAIADPGYFNFGGHRFRDDTPGGHGMVDMYRSIVVSCDTYYYMLANDLGIDTIAKNMKPFGFGQLTGIDIEGELPGILPSTAWKAARFKTPALQKWYAGETISVGIGQGYNSYTPLQMAHAVGILAADGVIKVPHLVRTIQEARDPAKSRLVDPAVPAGTPTRVDIKPEYIAFVKNAMAGVPKEGTSARVFAGAPYTSGGKTGTAQVFTVRQNEKYNEHHVAQNLRDHAWYTAFAPVDHPKIAVAVLVENGGWGASAAAPIARRLLDYVVAGKRPDTPGAAPEVGGVATGGADVESERD